MLYKILTVVVLSSFEIYVAIPTGFAMGLSPATIWIASIVGGLSGVFVAAFLGDKIRSFIKNLRKKKPEPELAEPKKEGLAHRLWNRYGIIGLGFFGTMTVGAPASIAVGVSLNAAIPKLITWCCIGVIVRCTLFTILGHYGAKLF